MIPAKRRSQNRWTTSDISVLRFHLESIFRHQSFMTTLKQLASEVCVSGMTKDDFFDEIALATDFDVKSYISPITLYYNKWRWPHTYRRFLRLIGYWSGKKYTVKDGSSALKKLVKEKRCLWWVPRRFSDDKILISINTALGGKLYRPRHGNFLLDKKEK